MSGLAGAIGTALSTLNAFAGQTVEYRAGTSGSWTALSNAFLLPAQPELVGFDDQRRVIMAATRARLKVQAGSTRLVAGPPQKPGYQVRHTNGTNITIWAVIAASHTDAQSIYELSRVVPELAGNDRGSVGAS